MGEASRTIMINNSMSNPVSQQMVAVIGDSIEKLTCLSVLSAQAVRVLGADTHSFQEEIVSEDLVYELREHIRLEELFIREASVSCSREMVVKSIKQIADKIIRIADFVSLIKGLHADQRSVEMLKFIHTLAEARELMEIKLNTTQEEDSMRKKVAEDSLSRQVSLALEKEKIFKELEVLRLANETENSKHEKEMLCLKSELHDLEQTNYQKKKSLDNYSTTQERMLREKFEEVIKEEKAKTQKLRENAANSNNVFVKEEDIQKKKNRLACTDLQRTMARISEEQIQEGSGQLNNDTEFEYPHLLMEMYIEQQTLLKTIEEEDAVEEERKKFLQTQNSNKKHAASLLQAFWKSIKQREASKLLLKKKRLKKKNK